METNLPRVENKVYGTLVYGQKHLNIAQKNVLPVYKGHKPATSWAEPEFQLRYIEFISPRCSRFVLLQFHAIICLSNPLIGKRSVFETL